MTKAKKVLYNAAYAAGVIAIVFVVWAASAAAIGSRYVLPNIPDTFDALGDVITGAPFWRGLAGTLLRCVISYAVSLGIALVLFFLCTAYKRFGRLAEPIISALRSLPAVAVTLIFIISVGGRWTPVVLGVIVIMPIMYSAARARISTVPRELDELCEQFGTNKFQKFGALWFPQLAGALPDILSSAFSYNIKAVIGAEILAQTASSLGMLMTLEQASLQTARLIALVFATVMISVAAESVIKHTLGFALKKYSVSFG